MNSMDSSVKAYPAPWELKGKGYILLYRFRRDFVAKHGNVPAFLKGSFVGGFGSVMLVDYAQSDAGPYGELLFIPGKFRFRGKRLNTISKIYVSTMESVVNGRANWGIPKEKAAFRFEAQDERTERAAVSVNGRTAAEFTIRSGRLSFPVSTKLLPFPLVQRQEGKHYFTSFFGKGRGRLARLTDTKIDPELFPDISLCRPIAVIRVEPFSITFPEAVVEDLCAGEEKASQS